MKNIDTVCAAARQAQYEIARLNSDGKNNMLRIIAGSLLSGQGDILLANKSDIDNCTKADQFIDRLRLTPERIKGMAEGITALIDLGDPVGIDSESWDVPSGLHITKRTVPIGVIGCIYEARPNVTADAIGLCVKSGNAVVLRGSGEAIESNKAIVKCIKDGLKKQGLPYECIQLITDTTREGAGYMMKLNKYIDVLIPRGGASLIQSVINNSTIPVIETGTGKCHIYIEKTADIDIAKKILLNAKTHRISVCNSAEGVMIDRALGKKAPEILDILYNAGVEIRGDKETAELYPKAKRASEDDYYTEYLDMVISCNIVEDYKEAADRINKYGTHHSDTIVTKDAAAAEYFLNNVDSAVVYHNASTRFTDGYEFGFGAEIGISTQKLHARGPVGLKELTSYKYIVRGNGNIRK